MGKAAVALVGALLGAGLALGGVALFGESLGFARRGPLEDSLRRIEAARDSLAGIEKGQEEVLALFKETKIRSEQIERNLAALEQERFGGFQSRLEKFDTQFKEIVQKHLQLHKDAETLARKVVEDMQRRIEALEKALKPAPAEPPKG